MLFFGNEKGRARHFLKLNYDVNSSEVSLLLVLMRMTKRTECKLEITHRARYLGISTTQIINHEKKNSFFPIVEHNFSYEDMLDGPPETFLETPSTCNHMIVSSPEVQSQNTYAYPSCPSPSHNDTLPTTSDTTIDECFYTWMVQQGNYCGDRDVLN